EIQTLSEAFDQMSSQIALNDEIMKARLSEAVSKYIAVVEELEQKNKTLGSVNQLKTDLLDSVSHEIRTPLTKILSYSELLSDSRILQNDEIRTKFASSMKSNINAIKNMFNDIITLSRLEHEQHIYHHIPVNIHEMAKEISELFDLEIKAKNLDITININKTDVIYVDGETFSSVISNIISNAVKYSKPQGKIVIEAYKENDNYIITCLDHGVGIPKDDIENTIERFFRASNVKKEFPGTGLGLSIVIRIIKAHKGEMNIESELNQYTKIIISLPLSEVGSDKSDISEYDE
ncbi:MAG: HAMP domain-containing histidine kinase, partial [Deferribacterales bacterium]|nr:HAMP domain-containing histidine kinase [Deferribacterales bacterium]